MSVSATLRYGSAPAQCAKAGSALTQVHCPSSDDPYDAEEKALAHGEGAAAAGEWLPPQRLPLPLGEVAAVEASERRGEVEVKVKLGSRWLFCGLASARRPWTGCRRRWCRGGRRSWPFASPRRLR